MIIDIRWRNCFRAISYIAFISILFTLPGNVLSADHPATTELPNVASMSAYQFTESIGVNTHLAYTDGKYANADRVLQDLQYLGISHVRDGLPASLPGRVPGDGLGAWDLLASAGIRFDVLVPWNVDLSAEMRQIQAVLRHHPKMITAVEGPNEINNWEVKFQGKGGEEGARAFQQELYREVHSEPSLKGLPVYYLTGGKSIDLATHPRLADYENAHPYPHLGQQPAGWLARDFQQYFTPSRPIPKVITETGYYTVPESRDWGGVDAKTQAKLLLNLYFDAAEQGVSRTFIYQLLDPYPDPEGKSADSNLGFFFLDNRPKPSATLTHDLMQFLADRPCSLKPMAFSINRMPETGHKLELLKADGTVIIALWNEVPVWDTNTSKPLNTTSVDVQIKLNGRGRAQWVDLLSGKRESLMIQDGSLSVSIPDHVIFVVLPPSSRVH
jgi:hypothetical protein